MSGRGETTMRATITDETTVSEIREMLRDDGFEHLAARAWEIKRAASTGCLVWTSSRIRTTDSSRIDEAQS